MVSRVLARLAGSLSYRLSCIPWPTWLQGPMTEAGVSNLRNVLVTLSKPTATGIADRVPTQIELEIPLLLRVVGGHGMPVE